MVNEADDKTLTRVLAKRLQRHIRNIDWMKRTELVTYYGEHEARQIMKDRALILKALAARG